MNEEDFYLKSSLWVQLLFSSLRATEKPFSTRVPTLKSSGDHHQAYGCCVSVNCDYIIPNLHYIHFIYEIFDWRDHHQSKVGLLVYKSSRVLIRIRVLLREERIASGRLWRETVGILRTMALLSDLINLDLSDKTEKIIAEYVWWVMILPLV